MFIMCVAADEIFFEILTREHLSLISCVLIKVDDIINYKISFIISHCYFHCFLSLWTENKFHLSQMPRLTFICFVFPHLFFLLALQLQPSILIICWLLSKYHKNNQVTKVAWLYIKTNLILTWNFLLFFNYIKSIMAE